MRHCDSFLLDLTTGQLTVPDALVVWRKLSVKQQLKLVTEHGGDQFIQQRILKDAATEGQDMASLRVGDGCYPLDKTDVELIGNLTPGTPLAQLMNYFTNHGLRCEFS